MSALFEARAIQERVLHLRECGKYVFPHRSLEIGEMAFCKSDFIIIKSNYFQNAQKREYFLDDFEALVCSRLTLAIAKCHFEGSEFKNVVLTI
jgi:hypothetical protein